MARTRAQLAAQTGRIRSAPKKQGKQPRGTQKPNRFHIARSHGSQTPQCIDYSQPLLVSGKKRSSPKRLLETDRRGTKRPSRAHDDELESVQKRPRRSARFSHIQLTPTKVAANQGNNPEPVDPIEFWASEGEWPREYFESKMEHLLARKKSFPNRKRSSSASSLTPSDQRPREEKSAPYRNPRYESLLGTKSSFMVKSSLDIISSSKSLLETLLKAQQTIPVDSLFQDDIFEATCQKIHNKNEARVIQDISRLIVPSAESLATFGAKHLNILIESVNEGWNNSLPLTGTRPQPDYSVGFTREAFTDSQLAKLSPFIRDFISGDQSFFMATYYMYFPFLTCEVKCGAAALDIADRQNAHSMTLAVRAVTKLFRAIKRENEVHRKIVAYSISHDHESVRIYGHYAVIDGKDTKYYRHPIRKYFFTELDGKEKWTAYQFTKNIYDLWMPSHFKKLCSAIDQLPSELDFDDPSMPSTGLSQDLQSHHLIQADLLSPHSGQDSQGSTSKQETATPSILFTDSGTAKKRRGEK
ncbi:hypothetical protein NOR_08325 [Metarhizium rileyi]|uniref:DUF7924 domain-containing protein n=1 Tax=Metarhizium rileyi (strain RCEF 4871) TaxID=1649241 RepID=A0A166WGA5_METRR|nr:hypothetical protein NOR_08325 [Metarhizium rileyi RCEF 4871]